jgi:hypothetical protein
MFMKKLLVGLLLALVVLTGCSRTVQVPAPVSVTTSSSVSSEFTPGEQAFLSDLNDIGVEATYNDKLMVTAGWEICLNLARGVDPVEIARGIYAGSNEKHPDTGVTPDQARGIVAAAVKNLCPERG